MSFIKRVWGRGGGGGGKVIWVKVPKKQLHRQTARGEFLMAVSESQTAAAGVLLQEDLR